MKYLLDTHTLIWFFSADKQLSNKAKKTIDSFSENMCFVSIASLWELAIKINLGKIEITPAFSEIKLNILKFNFEILPISFEHTLIVSALPLFHRDPFDRILIAQAMEENLSIISRDKNFQLYKNVNLLW